MAKNERSILEGLNFGAPAPAAEPVPQPAQPEPEPVKKAEKPAKKAAKPEKKAAVKAAQAEWLDSRPQANAGAYSSMTREQIMAIPDRQERLRAIAQNQNLFIGGN